MDGEVTSRRSVRVVVADDVASVRHHLADLLAEQPRVHIVAEADTVSAAIRSVRRHEPDAVVLDLHMPGGSQAPDGDGLTAVKYIKSLRPSTRILMCTNYAQPIYREACLEAGADFFFDKSAEFEEVGRVLAGLNVA